MNNQDFNRQLRLKARNDRTRPTGDATCSCGTVFMLDPSGKLTLLYRFKGSPDGANSQASLIRDAAGNLYGTTNLGGDSICKCGTVFKVDSTGKETVLHTFVRGIDGEYPVAGVIRDGAGNLYGATTSGGGTAYGTVFRIAP